MGRSLESLQSDIQYGFIDRNTDAAFVENPALIANEDESIMFSFLRSELATADSFIFSVAFVSADGVGAIKQDLQTFHGRGVIITGTYLDFNEPAALRELLTLKNVDVFVMEGVPHHAKGYIFTHSDHITAVIGSSNLTRTALISNREWNVRFSTHKDGDIAWQLKEAAHNHRANAVPLTEEWIANYEREREHRRIVIKDSQPVAITPGGEQIEPNAMQVEALSALDEVVQKGGQRALIISATGTGKTILAALAARQLQARRILFVVHREQILRSAAASFKQVLGLEDVQIGFLVGNQRETNREVVFSTIQSLSKMETLAEISPVHFDLVIVDEVHRSGAASYQRVLDYFHPRFTLGLTATPERSDGFNIYKLFDYNVPYEIRLEGALENHMLVPFDYYGVTDYHNARGSIGDSSKLSDLLSTERVSYIVEAIQDYSFAEGSKGLIFCSSNEEAAGLSAALNMRVAHGRRLRTKAISGSTPVDERLRVVSRLESGELDYILTVDIFNEGIDIPAVNVVIFLRSTESSIIFTQQLGRGLRKADGKKSLRVIDFIGNYANNYLIPIALTGEHSADPDKIREKVRKTRRNPVAGGSTVSFDEVSTARIVESLQKARLTSQVAKRKEIASLESRLGRTPMLSDFVIQQAMDPFILAATAEKDGKSRNYWSLLHKLGFVEAGPSAREQQFLSFMTVELLNGKRPQELLLLQELLREGPDGIVSTERYAEILTRWHSSIQVSEIMLRTVESILSITWFKDAGRKMYGDSPLAERDERGFRLGLDFAGLYFSYSESHPSPEASFRHHVDDVINTGLMINARRYGRSDELVVGEIYTRKDVSRLLNWSSNGQSTMFGYKVDKETGTCPIFVTYHKGADVAASMRYEDTLLDTSTMRWFSRHGYRLDSKGLQPILDGSVDLLLFVKREDAEGTGFYYLGQVDAENARQTVMQGNEGENLDVVVTDLKIRVPIESSLFDIITANKLVDQHGK